LNLESLSCFNASSSASLAFFAKIALFSIFGGCCRVDIDGLGGF
jgi:hypothetical protein